ncbi:unnamed protein product [Schistocephalus solidus]|uniref:Frizzled-8 n=1 Tax=Schistocephalus solidus TaxID=70667 RepID=A0A183SMR4_SCHSO|nr:unnamed protein product [Schistocephalus solidus]
MSPLTFIVLLLLGTWTMVIPSLAKAPSQPSQNMTIRIHRTVRQSGMVKTNDAESTHLSNSVPNGLADSVTYRHQEEEEEMKSPFGPHFGASIFSLGDRNDAVRDVARRPEKCVPIEIPMCKSIGYNLTYMPNEFNHETQEEAGLEEEEKEEEEEEEEAEAPQDVSLQQTEPKANKKMECKEVHQFYPLVKINCSADLRLFLCSLYAPICVPNWHWRLPACRSLCESARQGCTPVMRLYGFIWPERMNCDRFPEDAYVKLIYRSLLPTLQKQCVSRGENGAVTSSEERSGGVEGTGVEAKPPSKAGDKALWQSGEAKLRTVRLCYPCRCREPFIRDLRPPFNEVITGGVAGCLPSCHIPAFYDMADRTFATFWLGLWASLCALSTFTIVVTFLADPGRFQYPERPIVYLSTCYLLVGVGYLIRVVLGHENIACEGPVLRRGTTGPAQCSIVFLFTYLFGMAASVWWIILTFTWFLAAGLKWGSEAIAKYSQAFHFVAWFFPGAQAMTVLTMSAVDGDPVGGLCYVGATSITNLKAFVLAPLCFYLALGTIFLLAGFIALFRIRSVIKMQAPGGAKTEKLEKLMIRISIFGVLYTVPAAVVIACVAYEIMNRESWQLVHNCRCNDNPIGHLDRIYSTEDGQLNQDLVRSAESILSEHKLLFKLGELEGQHPQQENWHAFTTIANAQPEYAVFMLKYFMSLVVGITSGFWIWSSKTLESWRMCCHRIVRRDVPISPACGLSRGFTGINSQMPVTSPSGTDWNELNKARWGEASPAGDTGIALSSPGSTVAMGGAPRKTQWGVNELVPGMQLLPNNSSNPQSGFNHIRAHGDLMRRSAGQELTEQRIPSSGYPTSYGPGNGTRSSTSGSQATSHGQIPKQQNTRLIVPPNVI